MEVSIKDYKYDPPEITIKKGTSVTWKNNDEMTHTVTSEPDGSIFDSGTFEEGEDYDFSFETPGEYPYVCTIHPQMRGKVIVTE